MGPSAMGSVKGTPSSIMSEERRQVSDRPNQARPVTASNGSVLSIAYHSLTSTSPLHSQADLGSVLRQRVASGHIGDQGTLFEVCNILAISPAHWLSEAVYRIDSMGNTPCSRPCTAGRFA